MQNAQHGSGLLKCLFPNLGAALLSLRWPESQLVTLELPVTVQIWQQMYSRGRPPNFASQNTGISPYSLPTR